MTELIYEQPLNERIRSYLRLEYLSQQIENNLQQDHQHRCFYPLFSLCDLTDRCDYRNDLLKEIEKQLFMLAKWQQLPHANAPQIEVFVSQLTSAKEALQTPNRIGSCLKQDRFLNALRQRFGMPGACCNFDLPQLHFWLAKPWPQRQMEYRAWVDHFSPLLEPVNLLLSLIRSTGEFQDTQACGGFYQGDSAQPLSLIRVKLDANQGCYPTISGHKNRFAIHFVQFQEQRHSDKTIEFKLATCP
ncbi:MULTISPECIES: cell division protein ZapD [Shewanella]|uniref:Cell division protein ZapD n=1 Tax=Shewanella sedimentimangrovi TaxID=2814293 RepID=A0ABX7R259_9GAMM|nr:MULTISPECIES: cell division protein ZapD [Shewanella]QSX36921.1 cell division protein ZapD [Shewanella sedimentimangrovi]QSX40534.1 cell division protein ZapD [Shewanella cyperi]